jgi:hypothetical protein
MSADAHVNKTLIGKRNSDWVRWYLAFPRNQGVISYTPQTPFFADLEKARLGQIPWYQVLEEPGFLDTPLLVGGDVFAVPRELRPYIAGCYQQCRRDDGG